MKNRIQKFLETAVNLELPDNEQAVVFSRTEELSGGISSNSGCHDSRSGKCL